VSNFQHHKKQCCKFCTYGRRICWCNDNLIFENFFYTSSIRFNFTCIFL